MSNLLSVPLKRESFLALSEKKNAKEVYAYLKTQPRELVAEFMAFYAESPELLQLCLDSKNLSMKEDFLKGSSIDESFIPSHLKDIKLEEIKAFKGRAWEAWVFKRKKLPDLCKKINNKKGNK